jgi:KAP family P-loop domain
VDNARDQDGLLPGTLLDESGIDADHPDQFRIHTHVAGTIRRLAEKCPTPYVIGLFGGWGTGKTYIVGLLRKQLESAYPPTPQARLKFVYLDVWKFSRDPLRRWILIEMCRALAKYDRQFEEFKTSDGRALESHLRASESVSVHLRVLRPALLTWFRHSWIWLILLLATSAGILYLSGASRLAIGQQLANALAWIFVLWLFLSSIVHAIASATVRSVRAALTREETRTTTIGPAISAEQLGELFHQVVGAAAPSDAYRLVLCFDNLDRVPVDVAFATLSTIRTFMGERRCVYIIPCDAMALEGRLAIYEGPPESVMLIKPLVAHGARPELAEWLRGAQRDHDQVLRALNSAGRKPRKWPWQK